MAKIEEQAAALADIDHENPEMSEEERRIARGDFVEEGSTDVDALKAIATPPGGDPPATTEEGGDATTAAAADAAAGETDEDGKPLAAIPYARFKEVNDRARQLELDNARLTGEAVALRQRTPAGTAPPANGTGTEDAAPDPKEVLKGLRKAAADAMMEGDIDKHLEIQEQIEGIIEERATARAIATMTQARAQTDLDTAAAEVVKAFPFLDSRSQEANPEAIEDVLLLRDSLVARKGLSPAAALIKAAKTVAPGYAPASQGATSGVDKGEGKGADDPAANRNANALTRGAKAASTQPANPEGGKGNRGTPVAVTDVAKLSDAEFAALPKSEKARLRGDAV
jgi:hypothetical protein